MAADAVIELDRVCKAACPDAVRAERYAVWDVLLPWRRGRALKAGETWIFEDLSLTVRRGETVAVLRAVGGGGSTIAGLIGGLLLPDRGTVTVRDSCALLNQLGKGFKPLLTVEENLRFYAVLMGAPAKGLRDRCSRILEFAGLLGWEARRAHDLDRVQMRCLALSALLHLDARVLVLDGLSIPGDAAFRQRALALLEAQAEDRTVVVFAHRPQAIHVPPDRILVYRSGALVEFADNAGALAYWDENCGAIEREGRATPAEFADDDDDDDGDDGDGGDGDDGDGDGDGALPARKTRDLGGTVRETQLNGTPTRTNQQSFLLTVGDVVTVSFTYSPHHDISCKTIHVRLHAADVRHPLAAASVSPEDIVGANPDEDDGDVDSDDAVALYGAFRFLKGRRYKVSIQLVVPALRRGRYGVVAVFDVEGAASPKRYTHKLFAFGTWTQEPLGASLTLDLRETRIGAGD